MSVSIDVALRDLIREVLRDVVREVIRDELATAAPSTAMPMDSDAAQVLSVRKAAGVAGVTTRTIREWIQRGLPASRPVRAWMIRRDDLERFIARGAATPTPPRPSLDEQAMSILSLDRAARKSRR